MKRKVILSEKITSMDQDLVMYIKVDRLHEGTLILEVRILEIIERKFISFITVPFFFLLTEICQRELCFDAKHSSKVRAKGTQS